MKQLKGFLSGIFLCMCVICCLFISGPNAIGQTLPPGFSQVRVVSLGGALPMGFTAAPDGRLFVCIKSGDLLVVKNGILLSTPAIHLNVNQDGEEGLLSVAVDPNFSSNNYIYLYYTAQSPARNRLSRFTMNGDVVVPGSEVILLNLDPLLTNAHMGGGIAFGPDGKIYLASGENRQGSRIQQLDNYFGKLLRINPNGSAPSDNPFFSNPNAAAKYIWAYGFRNPYTLSVDPVSGKIFVNDIGSDPPAGWEEINDATVAGKNFGWAVVEGDVNNPLYADPVYTYPVVRNNSGTDLTHGCAITGGTFLNTAASNYPSAYKGKYYFVDFCNRWMNYINPSDAVPTSTPFAQNLANGATTTITGPDGNIYFITNNFTTNDHGVYKIVYTNTEVPVITSHPTSQTVSENQSVTFTVAASGASPLSYQWKKNNVNIAGATSASYTISNVAASHAGQYTVLVSNSAGSALSNAAELVVVAPNNPPVGSISTPTASLRYRFNDLISFSGSATDPEDGVLPASAFTWKIEFKHAQHFHPHQEFQGVTSGSFIANFPEVGTDVAYRVSLTVRDSKGLTSTTFRDVLPVTSTLSLATNISGLQLSLSGTTVSTPYSSAQVANTPFTIGAISPQTVNNVTYEFDFWSDGGAATHTINLPDNPTTYTANFKVSGQGPYGGTAIALPGTIEAENYDLGGQNVAYYDLSPANNGGAYRTDAVDIEGCSEGGFNVGWIDAQEWLEYTVNVTQTGTYKMDARVASISSSGSMQLEMDGVVITEILPVSSSGGWQNWQTLSKPGINLSSTGIHILRVKMTGGSFNLNKMVFTKEGTNNLAPLVSITNPSAGQSANINTPITMIVNASDPDGSVTKVEYYHGTSLIGTSNAAPWSFTYTPTVAGSYSLTAKAFDNGSPVLSTVSTAVNYTVTSSGNQPPVVSITSPTTNQSFQVNSVITITASASDPDGTVSKIEFYQGATFLGQKTSAPWTITFTPSTTGTYSLTAKAFDNGSPVLSTVSSAVSINVTPVSGGCTGSYLNDYSYVVSSAANNPTITFTPILNGVGSSLVLLYYGTGNGPYPGYSLSPNVPYQLNATQGQVIKFYFTYSYPTGGERNSSGSPHQVTIGSCGSAAPRIADNSMISTLNTVMYPNPMGESDLLYFAETDKNVSVKIVNASGVVVFENKNWNTGTPLSLKNLDHGLYQIISDLDGNVSVTKIVR